MLNDKEIECVTSYERCSSGVQLFTHAWLPQGGPSKCMVYLIHGLHGHCSLFHEMAIYLARNNIAVFSHDNYGHGRSSGHKVNPPSFSVYVDDAVERVRRIKAEYEKQCGDLKVFVFGHSLGGLIVLDVALALQKEISGCIFMSPAFGKSPDASKLSFMEPLLNPLSAVMPWFPVPTNLNVQNFTSVAKKQRESQHDPLLYHGAIKLKHAAIIVNRMKPVMDKADQVGFPYFLLAGSEDIVTPIPPMREFHSKTGKDIDKTFTLYDKMRHCLYIEKEEMKSQCFADMKEWIVNRV